ncbi:MAG TPA: hypothetical protein VL688_05475 [Verrucomicrobiae bacterium]|jgi:hypothetical protein|nr:hypothetical protein [Verrucomicrobiae bacterium]
MNPIRVCKPISWTEMEPSEIRKAVLKAAAEFYPQWLTPEALSALGESEAERTAGGRGATAFLIKIFTAFPETGDLKNALEEIRRVTDAAGPRNIFLFFPWMENQPQAGSDLSAHEFLWKACRSVRAVQYHFLAMGDEKAVSFREIFSQDTDFESMLPEMPLVAVERPLRSEDEPYSFYRKSRLSQEELREFFELGLEIRGIKLAPGA